MIDELEHRHREVEDPFDTIKEKVNELVCAVNKENILSCQDCETCAYEIEGKIKSLQSEVERLKDQIKPLQEITQSLLGEETVCRDRIISLEEKAARLESRSFEANKRLDDLETTHAKNINVLQRRQDTHSARLTALELPNQSDCPLGKKCVEDKGYWHMYFPMGSGGNSFEECGESCPKKKEETIKWARDYVEALHGARKIERFRADKLLKALDFAE